MKEDTVHYTWLVLSVGVLITLKARVECEETISVEDAGKLAMKRKTAIF